MSSPSDHTSTSAASDAPSTLAPPVADFVDLNDDLEPLRQAIAASARVFYVAGDIPVASPIAVAILPDDKTLQTCAAVRFPPDSPEALAPLIDACKQASFGRGQEEVLDSRYRQALVLHRDRFGIIPPMAVDPFLHGITIAIQQALYPSTDFGGSAQRRVVAELDKLNVYGVGDFFKSHVDTPRSSDMFGTLLINLPAKHEGGELVVHAPEGHPEGGEPHKTTWGSGESMGWVAFFSDCPHEVLPVTSGNRLSIVSSPTLESASMKGLAGAEYVGIRRVVEALTAPGILDEKHPYLLFYLEHRYPADLVDSDAADVLPILKGCDATVYHAFVAAGFKVTFHYVLMTSDDDVERYTRFEDSEEENAVDGDPPRVRRARKNDVYILPQDARHRTDYLYEGGLGEIIADLSGLEPERLGAREIRPAKDEGCVGWDKRIKTNTIGAPFTYLAYGNEPSIEVDYASICIIASPGAKDVAAVWDEKKRKNRSRFYST